MRKSRKKKEVPSKERVDRLGGVLQAVSNAFGVTHLPTTGPSVVLKFDYDNLLGASVPHFEVDNTVHVAWNADDNKWVVYTMVIHRGVRYRADGSGEPDEEEENVIDIFPDAAHYAIAECVGKTLADVAISNALENHSLAEMAKEEERLERELDDIIEPRPWGKRKYIPPTKISSSKR